MIIGIDQSKRSTALVCLHLDGQMKDFTLINPPLTIDKEELIEHQWTRIEAFFCKQEFKGPITGIALEGAAFNAAGSSSDLLWGIQWYIRTRIFVEYPDVPIGILTAATWRSTILTRDEQREFKLQYNGKIGLKHAVVSKLPADVKSQFEAYIEEHRERLLEVKGFKPDSRSQKYKECLFDLADAWGIATHRLLLGVKKCDIVKKEKAKKISTLRRRFPNAK